jgi:hypothetical protein
MMNHAIVRVPDAPHPHIAVTVRTAQRGSRRALLIPLTVGHRGDNLDDSLHETFDLG